MENKTYGLQRYDESNCTHVIDSAGKYKAGRRCLHVALCITLFTACTILPNDFQNSNTMPGVQGYILIGSFLTLSLIIGGCLGDAILGPYNVILMGAVFNIIGMIILEGYNIFFFKYDYISYEIKVMGWFSKSFISIGVGFILSCIIPFLGWQCDDDQERDSVFLWYVWSVDFATWLLFFPTLRILQLLGKYKDLIMGATRIFLLLLMLTSLKFAKWKGWFRNNGARGKLQFRLLVFEYIPRLWRKYDNLDRTTNENQKIILRRFFLYLGLIMAALITYEMVWTQLFVTIPSLAFGILQSFCNNSYITLCKEEPCDNTTYYWNITEDCVVKAYSDAYGIVSVSPFTAVLLIPFIQYFFKEENLSQIAKYRRYQRLIYSGMILSGASMLCAFLYLQIVMTNYPKLYSAFDVFWLLPTCILIGLADITTIKGVYSFAFAEAQNNLPGLECIYTSLATMCIGTGGLMAIGIYYAEIEIYFKVHTMQQPLNTISNSIHYRAYYYLILMCLALILSAILYLASWRFNKIIKLHQINELE